MEGRHVAGENGRFDAILSKTNRTLAGLANISMWALAAVVVYQIVARHAGHPPIWSDEVSVYLMLVLSFFGIGHTWSEDGHFRITLFTQMMSENTQRILRLLVLLISFAFTVGFTYGAYRLTSFSFMLNLTTPTALKVPLGLIQGVIFVGGLFLALALIQDIVRVIRRQKGAESNPSDILQ